jgi:hypothetical protein
MGSMRYIHAIACGLVGAAAIVCTGCKGSGPSFANASGDVIRLQAHFDSEPFNGFDWLPLRAGEVFRDPSEQQLVDIAVEAHGQLFHLNAEQVSKARRDVVVRKQIWLFDGEAICMLTVQEYGAKQAPRCAASR